MSDFPVQNVVCPTCHSHMWFSNQHSSDVVAIFYCNDESCRDYGYLHKPEEVIWMHAIVEKDND